MKIKKHLVALLTVIAVIASVLCLNACGDRNDNNGAGTTKTEYTVTVDADKSLNLEIGDTVDYRQYFTVTDNNGNQIVVTDEMLDLSKVDTTKAGQFTVTLAIGNASKSITFTVNKKDEGGNGDGGDDNKDDLATVLAKYTDSTKWNFATALTYTYNGDPYEEYYEYNGNNVKYVWEEDGDRYTDYISYVPSTDKYYYYAEQGNGSYEKYEEDTEDFDNWFWYAAPVDLTEISDFEFTENNGVYTAKKPNDVGNSVIGEYTSITWTSFKLTIKNDNLATITATMSDGETYTYTFSKFGTVNFSLPIVSGGSITPVTPTGTMDKQTYNAATFDNGRLQDKITKTGDEPDPAIGLPSKGKYNALVIPVQFSNKTIDANDLADLNIAFNGDYDNTGWESVHSYYYKSSYQQLDISFDIAGYNIVQQVPTFTARYNYSYYETHTATDPDTREKYNDGDNLLLHEALKYYDSYIDFSDYDYNDDNYIDAVYLIYSAPVDYESDDSFYWAYVTWNYDDSQYDGLDVFYYLFAGLDFMIESVHGGYVDEYYPEIEGLKVNASTYIHETGHLLGLDDYYDYDENSGCNEGLGGADMMDATVGDQNVYSKIMLGWLTPQIVVSTQTITIKSSQAEGSAILIPLNFNNSYFCEYLLIDLYSADGLNALHASTDNSYLYDGASYGVRIYHVSSSINNVYNTDYGSFTDYNNTDTNFALIKLIEADGTTKYSNSSGYAADSDLWQAGKTFSKVFPSYTTNAGKKLNFDISIDSVSATQATITITYAA